MPIQKILKTHWDLDETRVLTACELEKLRRSTSERKDVALQKGPKCAVRDWFIVTLGVESGLRVQEMRDLNCGDFRITEGRKSIRVRSGKGGKARTVYIRDQFAKDVLMFVKWKKACGESIDSEAPVISVCGRRASVRGIQKSFVRSKRLAGVVQVYRVGIHSLRHTYATFLLAATGNLRLVQRQLGHSSINTTEIYAHILDAMQQVEKLYASSRNTETFIKCNSL